MNEKTETTTPWPFAPGQIVRDSGEGDDAAWLECAPEGTVLRLPDTTEVTMRHGLTYCWRSDDDSVYTSVGLVAETDGPLTVVSVPEPEHRYVSTGPVTGIRRCACGAAWTDVHEAQAATPTPTETTGAVEAAAEAILEACHGQELPEAPIDLARAALVAALDVEQMARVLIDHTRIDGIHGDCSCGHVVPLGRSFAAHQAAAYRAAIVGPDLEAPASTATDAVQERPEPQTARSASDGSQAVHGAPAISLGGRMRDAIQTWRSQTSEPDPANDEVIEVGGYSFWRLVQEVGDLADEADETEYQLDRTRAAHERDVQNLGQANTRLSGEVDRLKAALLPDGAINVHEECNREIAELEAALQRVREIVPTLRKIWAGEGEDVGETIDVVEELVGQALDGGTGAER